MTTNNPMTLSNIIRQLEMKRKNSKYMKLKAGDDIHFVRYFDGMDAGLNLAIDTLKDLAKRANLYKNQTQNSEYRHVNKQHEDRPILTGLALTMALAVIYLILTVFDYQRDQGWREGFRTAHQYTEADQQYFTPED